MVSERRNTIQENVEPDPRSAQSTDRVATKVGRYVPIRILRWLPRKLRQKLDRGPLGEDPARYDLVTPPEYDAWVSFEVIVPLAAPVLVFVMLSLSAILAKGTFTDALITVSGTGDFLLIAALLLINAAAKIEIITKETASFEGVSRRAGDARSVFLLSIFFLASFVGSRVVLVDKTTSWAKAVEFSFGVVSAVLLVVTIVRLHKKLCDMYLSNIKMRLERGPVRSRSHHD